MKLVQCAEGHYYDADISSTCPHCRKNEASVQEDATSVYLRKIGLLDCAEQQYHILVRLEDGRILQVSIIKIKFVSLIMVLLLIIHLLVMRFLLMIGKLRVMMF